MFPFWNCGFNFPGIIWIGLIILVIWLVVKNNNTQSSLPPSLGETPLDILKKRYAKGEISHEDYEKMKNDLGN